MAFNFRRKVWPDYVKIDPVGFYAYIEIEDLMESENFKNALAEYQARRARRDRKPFDNQDASKK